MDKDFEKMFGDIVSKGLMKMADTLSERQKYGELSPEELITFSNGQMMGIVKSLMYEYHLALLEHLRIKAL